MTRRLLATLGPWAVAGALVWLTGSPAAAHASLLSTDPEAGAVVAQAPNHVVFTFNEPVRLDGGAVHAFRADGSDWAVSAQVQDNRLIVTPDEDPGTGTVVVAWEVISQDGHRVSGALTFSVGASSAGAPASRDDTGSPASVTAVRSAAGGVAALGLLTSLVMAVRPASSRRPDLVWNAGLVAAVLLAPLHELAGAGRGLGGLTDWLTWLDGVARPSSLLLLGAYATAAAARSVPRRLLAVTVTATALVLLGGAAYTWPSPDSTATPAAAPSGPVTTSVALGAAGTVRLTVNREAGRTVTLALALLDVEGQPLTPFAPPTLTVRNDDLSLGDATLTETGPGAYRAELTIPAPGVWSAGVSVRTDEFDNPVAVVPFTVW